jgi:hypothetical protein
METEAKYLASGTNWALEVPRWNDGNDLFDVSPAQRDSSNRYGGIVTLTDLPTTDHPAGAATMRGVAFRQRSVGASSRYQVRDPRWIPMTTLEIVVH